MGRKKSNSRKGGRMRLIKREITLELCKDSTLSFEWFSHAGFAHHLLERIDGLEGTYKITIEKQEVKKK